MPRSRSRSPRDRYGSNRYRGGGTSSNGRRRNSRSRSRSPRERSDRTHRDRYQQRPERSNKRYSRSRSRTRSPSPKAFGNKIVDKRLEPTKRIFDPSELQGKTEDEIEMLKTMGFASFDTTKGKHTDGATNAHGTNIQQKRRYRQYMNRKGGFNRPLDPIA